jgi:hypothetical protein
VYDKSSNKEDKLFDAIERFEDSIRLNKGNNKTTELRTILQRESQNRNDSNLVQLFLRKWWVESDFKAPNLPLSLRLKGSGCLLFLNKRVGILQSKYHHHRKVARYSCK